VAGEVSRAPRGPVARRGGRFARARALLERARRRGVFESAVVLVAVEGQPVLHEPFGGATLDSVFDLASLTKPLATTAAAMRLVAEGRLDLSERAAASLPGLDRPGARDIRLEHLLAHASGMPAWLPLHEQVRALAPRSRRTAARRLVARTALAAPPGREAVYSDLGFILLDWLLERRTGERLDRLAARTVFRPLGLARTFFVDLARPGAAARVRARLPVVETEWCPELGRRLCAEVHDDNCRAMGGVAGHAGLFSTAYEVHLLARELVLAARGQRSLFDRDVVRRFFEARPVRGSTRALGWDTPSSSDASCGHRFPRRSVGHLGFTGTSLWIDLSRPLWVVVLSNRVHGGREPNTLKPLRPLLHDALLEAL
jgi:serine-type D-Ala-D-Ala carboxypeptidase